MERFFIHGHLILLKKDGSDELEHYATVPNSYAGTTVVTLLNYGLRYTYDCKLGQAVPKKASGE